jgi:aspartyl-tRNA(Asn)/glutamyl-tRNA(Gln) amidotransferase subunit C
MNRDDIVRLANLARIELTDAEIDAFSMDIGGILGYISQIKEITGEAPEEKVAGAVHSVFREDTEPHEAGKYTNDLLSLAPMREGPYVKVKKILGDS